MRGIRSNSHVSSDIEAPVEHYTDSNRAQGRPQRRPTGPARDRGRCSPTHPRSHAAPFLGRSSRTAEHPADNRKAGGATPPVPTNTRRKCYGSTRARHVRSAGSTPARRSNSIMRDEDPFCGLTLPTNHGASGVVACTPVCDSGSPQFDPGEAPQHEARSARAAGLPLGCRPSTTSSILARSATLPLELG